VIRPESCGALQEQFGDPSGSLGAALGSPCLTISSSAGIGDLAIVSKLTQTPANSKPPARFQANRSAW
jgi:hypothetical protein